ncbi:YihY/virulence factor BrkB family protein [uncultured Desulfuromonas sp.]|uniref:YihY/virulence factor BrkB family protein n=1 Tax=uncultured Desulfuromonas sp. TaxID=181013 RepID=UPI002AABDF91|nr:YihY/virulence factor BrkB family protein [uncultured Desulfuromonas sp.]
MALKASVEKWQKWLARDLWADDGKQGGYDIARVLAAALIGFRRHNCIQHAAALTFNTLLALIPLLAIMFALLKGLGVHNTIEPLLLKQLSVGSEEVVANIITYINNTNVGRLGSVGLVMLVFTVLALLSNIEKSFNDLWQVQETRSLFRRFADYFSVVTLGPLFVLAAVSMNTSIRSQHVVQWLLSKPVFGDALLLLFEVLPFFAIWAAFIFLYMFVPNTKVKLLSALVGGISAGSLWLLTQWSYVNFQYGVGKYNAIYGTMAALPIFMIWLYVSWMITLMGVELCWAFQFRSHISRLLGKGSRVDEWEPMHVLELLVLIYNRFKQGRAPWPMEELLEAASMPKAQAHLALERLKACEIVVVADDETHDALVVVPQKSADIIDLARVLEPGVSQTLDQEVSAVIGPLNRSYHDYLSGFDLPELIQKTTMKDSPQNNS